jgi:hypothetical protein
MANLYVAIYKPREGNVHHWALWLEATNWSMIFEAEGEPGKYKLKERKNKKPSSSSRHQSNVFIAQIDDVAGFTQNARSCTPAKDSAAWDCQEYVLEVLEAANDDGIINDYDHQRIKSYLESIYNR